MHFLHVRTTVRVTNTNRKTPSGVPTIMEFERTGWHRSVRWETYSVDFVDMRTSNSPLCSLNSLFKCTCFRNWSETRIFHGRHVRPTVKARDFLLFLREYV